MARRVYSLLAICTIAAIGHATPIIPGLQLPKIPLLDHFTNMFQQNQQNQQPQSGPKIPGLDQLPNLFPHLSKLFPHLNTQQPQQAPNPSTPSPMQQPNPGQNPSGNSPQQNPGQYPQNPSFPGYFQMGYGQSPNGQWQQPYQQGPNQYSGQQPSWNGNFGYN